MLAVSTQWQNASREQFRYQAYLKVALEIVPPGIRQGLSVSSDATFSRSDVEEVADGIKPSPKRYATFEHNRFALDGSYNVFPSTADTDIWWTEKSIASGSTAVLHFDFDKAYTIPGMHIVWDTESGSFPERFTVKGYASADGDEPAYTITVTDVTSVEGFFDSLAMDNITAVDLVIDSWGLHGWRGRVSEITFGMIIEVDSVNNGRIISATQTSKADPLNRQLPTHNLDIKLRNYDKYFDPELESGVSKYLAKQQVVKAQWMFTTGQGVVEYAPQQAYLTESFSIPTGSKDVELHMTNRLATLDKEFKMGNYTGSERSLKAIAEYVLSNSDVLKETNEQEPWVLADELDAITTLAPIPAEATNVLLQLLALAGCTWLTTRGTDGFIQFLSAQPVSEFCAITPKQELGDPEISIQDQLRSLSVGVYTYTTRSAAENIGSANYTLSGVNVLTVKYKTDYATGVTATVSGATLTSAVYYASYAVLTVTAEANAAVTVTLSGTVIDQTITYIEIYRNSIVTDGKDVTIENPFITSVAHAQQVAAYVLEYYLKRNAYTVPYLGYPQLEAGDSINLETVYGSGDVDVTENTIKFNGGWEGTASAI